MCILIEEKVRTPYTPLLAGVTLFGLCYRKLVNKNKLRKAFSIKVHCPHMVMHGRTVKKLSAISATPRCCDLKFIRPSPLELHLQQPLKRPLDGDRPVAIHNHSLTNSHIQTHMHADTHTRACTHTQNQ